jgi:hypothetical protein
MILTIVRAFSAMRDKRPTQGKDTRISLYAMLSVHIQAVLGLILYSMSSSVQFHSATMSDSLLRFFTVEHVFGMLVAVILVTLGHRRCKTGASKAMFWFYTIALLIILLSIPWPFRGFGNGWF